MWEGGALVAAVCLAYPSQVLWAWAGTPVYSKGPEKPCWWSVEWLRQCHLIAHTTALCSACCQPGVLVGCCALGELLQALPLDSQQSAGLLLRAGQASQRGLDTTLSLSVTQ